ncbi:MAG: hypothetical protein ACOYNY_40015 [Caldilineaceae bacterium]
MGSISGTSTRRRQQLLLLGALVLALFITVFFGLRAFRRFDHPPSDEPIRGWMNIPYIAHSYQVPPPFCGKRSTRRRICRPAAAPFVGWPKN